MLFNAVAHDKLALGFVGIGGMLAGITVTLSIFALSAVFARERYVALLNSSEHTRRIVAVALEFTSASALVVLGTVKFLEQVG